MLMRPTVSPTASMASSSRAAPCMSAALPGKARYFPFAKPPAELEGYVGSEDGFDPLGISENVSMLWLREAELKHGRIAMLAVVGFIVPDAGLWKLDNDVFAPSILAHDACASQPYGGPLGQVWLFCAAIEVFVGMPALVFTMISGGERAAGDFAFDPLGLGGGSAAQREAMQYKELKHGRTAMLAFGGIATQAALGHPGFPYVW